MPERAIEALKTHWRSVLAGALLLAALLGTVAWLWPRPAPPLAILTPTPRPTASPAPLLAVHVIGAVASPGVYRLPSGSRAEHAIAQAGGFTEDADPSSLNLAAPLVDGQQLVIRTKSPTRPPTEPSAPGPAPPNPSARLNLNHATAADLDQLPGIGSALAQRILDRRQRLGPFQSTEQLRDEKLIPAATYDRIKDLIAVSDAISVCNGMSPVISQRGSWSVFQTFTSTARASSSIRFCW